MKKSFGEPLGFVVSLLILPWAFWFCREVRSGYNMFYIIVRAQEARLALGCVSSNSHASFLLSKLPTCIHNSIYAR